MMLGMLIPRSSDDFSDRSLNMLLLDFVMKIVKVLDHSFLTATAKSLESCPTLCDPIDSRPPGSTSLGFSRQEHWSGLPFPSPIRASEVAQSCLTLSNPMDCSLPGSSIHGIFQARVLEWVPYEINDHNYVTHNYGKKQQDGIVRKLVVSYSPGKYSILLILPIFRVT